jgi:beta-aspartyl-peptidase (threonine type)
MAGYGQSPELSFYSGKDKRQGWQETFDRYRKRYQGEGKEMGRVSFTELDIQMLGPDTALVRGRWKVIMSKEQPEGLFTLVMKRFPEGWRIIHDHTSSG